MGFYVRKSLRAGPFRFNLSKSGLGVSAGVPGFRVGTGPRGNYVHVGSHGVYYRATINGRKHTPTVGAQPAARVRAPSAEVALEDMTGATAEALIPTGADDLVAQLNEAAGRLPLWPIGLVATVVLVAGVHSAVAVVLVVFGLGVTTWLWLRDRARRSVVAFYEVEGPQAGWLESLLGLWRALAQADGLWRVNAAGPVTTTYQYKTNAGASNILSRARLVATLQPPPVLVTNIAVPSLVAGRQALHFLPDRLLVRNGRRYSDLSYGTLQLQSESTRFIESGSVPRDAQQVATTWQYVNVKGGPDRRFKNNRQLPVMLYGRMLIASQAGLRWIVDVSRPALAEQAARAIQSAEAPKPVPAPALPPAA